MSSHTVDIRADIYSLGATLYFLLTGQVPFPGGTLAEKLMNHQLKEPEPVEKLRRDVPPEVAKIVRKMMAKKAEDRFQTPGAVAKAITDGAAGQNNEWPLHWLLTFKLASRRNLLFMAGGACICVLFALLAIAFFSMSSTTKEASRPSGQTKQPSIEELARVAQDTLKTSPSDPQANLALGTYLCFVKGDWKAGLEKLAKGSDSSLADIAKQDSAKPMASAQCYTLAESWWARSEKEQEQLRPEIHARAKLWFEQSLLAAPPLPESARQQALNRLREMLGKLKLSPGLVGEFYKGVYFDELDSVKIDPVWLRVIEDVVTGRCGSRKCQTGSPTVGKGGREAVGGSGVMQRAA